MIRRGEGASSFLAIIYERLVLMRDLLAPDGSIYVHLDYRMIHHVRIVLDEVFGPEHTRTKSSGSDRCRIMTLGNSALFTIRYSTIASRRRLFLTSSLRV